MIRHLTSTPLLKINICVLLSISNMAERNMARIMHAYLFTTIDCIMSLINIVFREL